MQSLFCPIEQSLHKLDLYTDINIMCCVCFTDKSIVTVDGKAASLSELEKTYFVDQEIPDDILFKCCTKHFLCVQCVRHIISNYENHPINSENSHFSCPYPFEDCVTEIGFKCILDHNLIQKVCKTDDEWNKYIAHASNFEFPGYTIIKCPLSFFSTTESTNIKCNTNILLENEKIRDSLIGEFIIRCDQNPRCLRSFCYYCKKGISYINNICFECKLNSESEIPNGFNYFFNKNNVQLTSSIIQSVTDVSYSYEEKDYLYTNSEITVEIALNQLIALLKDVNTFMICPICKISLYKTERCNGLSHHGVERCYACGRIGYKTRGLCEHWSNTGKNGCFRFDHEQFVHKYVPTYLCNEHLCSSHEKGDCNISEHENGRNELDRIRLRAYVYHALCSLPSNIRYRVYDALYNYIIEHDDTLVTLIPYKQSLKIVEKHKSRVKDYIEEIVYEQLHLTFPEIKRNEIVELELYETLYKCDPVEIEESPVRNTSTVSAWRQILNTDLLTD